MANWSNLKASVASVIKTNGNQEITGKVLQNILTTIISNLGENSTYAGIATPDTNPGNPDGNVFYLATEAGTYSNFNGIEIKNGEATILEWKGSWVKKTVGLATTDVGKKVGLNFSLNPLKECTIKNNTISIPFLRIGTSGYDEFYDVTDYEQDGLTGNFDYIVADLSDGVATLSKGTLTNAFREEETWSHFVLCFKNDKKWCSRYAVIQSIIDNSYPYIEDNFYIGNNLFTIGNNDEITITFLRWCTPLKEELSITGIKIKDNSQIFTTPVPKAYAYIIANINKNNITLEYVPIEYIGGSPNYPWLIDYSQKRFPIMTYAEGLWQSHFPSIQKAIEQAYRNRKQSKLLCPGNIPYSFAYDLVSIPFIRCVYNGGFVDAHDVNIGGLGGSMSYLVVDIDETLQISKGTKDLAWQEEETDTHFVLCYKHDNLWFSKFPQLTQKIIECGQNVMPSFWVVDPNGGGDYTDLKECINSITSNNAAIQKVVVKNGIYDYSNDGDNIGVLIKNNVIIEGESQDVKIIKRDTEFAWGKATMDIDTSTILTYACVRNVTVISKGCKCPIHVDSQMFRGTICIENVNLINESELGTEDNPVDGEANCFALGFSKNCHVKLIGVRANGKLWAHNSLNSCTNSTFELIGCNCRVIQIGDISSGGNDKVIIKGCTAEQLQLLWFSELTGDNYRQSFTYELHGNNIERMVVDTHTENKDALQTFYGGHYPAILENYKYMQCNAPLLIGNLVYEDKINHVSIYTLGKKFAGVVVENSFNNNCLVQRKGIVNVTGNANSESINFGDPVAINSDNKFEKSSQDIIGYAVSELSSGEGKLLVKII